MIKVSTDVPFGRPRTGAPVNLRPDVALPEPGAKRVSLASKTAIAAASIESALRLANGVRWWPLSSSVGLPDSAEPNARQGSTATAALNTSKPAIIVHARDWKMRHEAFDPFFACGSWGVDALSCGRLAPWQRQLEAATAGRSASWLKSSRIARA